MGELLFSFPSYSHTIFIFPIPGRTYIDKNFYAEIVRKLWNVKDTVDTIETECVLILHIRLHPVFYLSDLFSLLTSQWPFKCHKQVIYRESFI